MFEEEDSEQREDLTECWHFKDLDALEEFYKRCQTSGASTEEERVEILRDLEKEGYMKNRFTLKGNKEQAKKTLSQFLRIVDVTNVRDLDELREPEVPDHE